MLGDVASAGAAATRALAAGRRSRPSVLAHARHQALAAATTPPSYESSAAEGDTVALGIGTDVVGLARALASTRPPVERVVVDMDSRHDLDRAGLGRALGLAPARAAARAAEVAERWDKELSPPLLAALGPGQCDGLVAVLAHGGEAQASRDAFAALAPVDRACLIEFLKSLQSFPPDTPALIVDERGVPRPELTSR